MDSERCNIEIAGNKNPTVYLFYIMMAFKTRIVKGPILGTDVFAPGPSSAAAAAAASSSLIGATANPQASCRVNRAEVVCNEWRSGRIGGQIETKPDKRC